MGAPPPVERGELRPSALRRALPALLVAAAVAELLREAWRPGPQLDDAYISYRYARNLVEGLGLVYNAGERVEGFTNLLWTLLVAAGIALGQDAPAVGHALGLASAAGVLVATAIYAATGLPRERALPAAAAAWLVLVSPAFAEWATLGMETCLFALLTTAALAAEARGRIGAATLIAFLATLTRPEGGLVAAVVLASHVLGAWRRERASSLAWPLGYAGLLACLTLFRLAYYGAPLPNTFYAKVGGLPWSAGLYYAQTFLAEGAWWLLLPAWLGVRLVPELRPGAIFAATVTVYAIAIGGDVFAHSRFFLPVLPALAALATRGAAAAAARDARVGALAWATLAAAIPGCLFGLYALRVETSLVILVAGLALCASLERGRPRPVWIAAAALALGLRLALPPPADLERLRAQLGRVTREQALTASRRGHERLERLALRRSEVLRVRGEPVGLVATGGIGAFGWHSRLPILDIFGLVDPRVARSHAGGQASEARSGRELRRSSAELPRSSAQASEVHQAWIVPGHHRADADYVFSRAPDYLLIPRRGPGLLVAPATLTLWEHPALAADYVWDPEVVGYRRLATTR